MPKHLPDVSDPVFTMNETLDDDLVKALAAHHGISEDYDLYGALTDAAFWYHLLSATKDKRLTHAKHKAYLEEIAKRATALEDALKQMNAHLTYELHHRWPHLASRDS